jgi:Protein of unknown function (DUF2846)
MISIAPVRGILTLPLLALMASCASVPMASAEQDATSKKFAAPSSGKAGVYVFRDTSFGAALKKTLYVDGVAIGETARYVFLRREVDPGEHTLSTESEFGNNDLAFKAIGGTNHFFRQYIKFGVFVGGANLEAVSEEKGKKGVLACEEALGFTSNSGAGREKPPQR